MYTYTVHCTVCVNDPDNAGSLGTSLAGTSTHAVGTGNKNIILIYDCTAHVGDPDSAGSFANGPSLAGASTYAVGTGNKNIILNVS